MWARSRRSLLFPRCPVESFQYLRVVRRVREIVAERCTVQDAVGEVFAHPHEMVSALDLVKDGVLSEVVLLQDRILLEEPKRIVEVEPALGTRESKKFRR